VKVFNRKFNLIVKKIKDVNKQLKKNFVPELVGKEVEHRELPHSQKAYNK